jgi:hypothetical protein
VDKRRSGTKAFTDLTQPVYDSFNGKMQPSLRILNGFAPGAPIGGVVTGRLGAVKGRSFRGTAPNAVSRQQQ